MEKEMKIEVNAVSVYTVKLNSEDIRKIKNYILLHELDITNKAHIIYAIQNIPDIAFYSDGKYNEIACYTSEIRWSGLEHQEPKEIFDGV